jgi:hypothetical protein
MGESLGSKISTGSEASPNAKATGTRIASNKKKPPKRTNAAIDGERREEVKSQTLG